MVGLLLKQENDTNVIASGRMFFWVGHKAASSNLFQTKESSIPIQALQINSLSIFLKFSDFF